jgi:hypothetical protein
VAGGGLTTGAAAANGIVIGTFLTLFVVPAMCSFLTSRKGRVSRFIEAERSRSIVSDRGSHRSLTAKIAKNAKNIAKSIARLTHRSIARSNRR